MSPLRKRLYTALGYVMVGCGIAGVILPGVPTTPFVLLAAYLFSRSNERLHAWLLSHKHLGPYIRAFRGRKGLTIAQKVRIGLSITIAMGFSILMISNPTLKIGLGGGWAFWMSVLVLSRTAAAASPPVERAESATSEAAGA